MVNPIPDKVKDALSELSAGQQVTIRGYIGTLRAEIKELEEKIRGLKGKSVPKETGKLSSPPISRKNVAGERYRDQPKIPCLLRLFLLAP